MPQECVKGKPTGAELSAFALKIVASMRGVAAGLIYSEHLKDWTKEELHGAADLLLKDVKEGRTEELEKLYMETCGQPFKEAGFGT